VSVSLLPVVARLNLYCEYLSSVKKVRMATVLPNNYQVSKINQDTIFLMSEEIIAHQIAHEIA
jgi:hypothetical protein